MGLAGRGSVGAGVAVLQLLPSDVVAQRAMSAGLVAQQARSDALASGLTPEQADAAAEEASSRVHAGEHRPRRQGGWKNVIAARFLAAMLGYEPIEHLGNVRVPVFLRVATKDHICPPDVAEAAVARFGGDGGKRVTLHRADVSHIEALVEGVKEGQIAPVLAFLRRHLLGEGEVVVE